MKTSLLRTRPATLSSPPFPFDKKDATPDEIFVADGWHKSWQTSDYAGTSIRSLAFNNVLATIQHLANRGMQIHILESPQVDTFVGFVAFEVRPDGRNVLHYIYVKDALRRRGFSKLLLDLVDTRRYFYTHKHQKFTRYLPRGTFRREFAVRKHL